MKATPNKTQAINSAKINHPLISVKSGLNLNLLFGLLISGVFIHQKYKLMINVIE